MEQKKAKKTITLSIKIVDNKTKNVENIKNIEITTKTFEYMKRHPNPFYQPEMNTKEFQDNDQNTNIIVTADTKDEESITKKDWLCIFKKLWKNKIISFKQFWKKRKEIKKSNKN